MHLFIIHFILSFISFNGSSVFLVFHDTGIFKKINAHPPFNRLVLILGLSDVSL